MDILYPLILIAIIAGLLYSMLRPQERRAPLDFPDMPDDLRGAELVCMEGVFVGRFAKAARQMKSKRRVFVCREPAFLSGTPDVVALQRRQIIPIDWKHRKGSGQVYMSDRVQLTVYSALMAEHPLTKGYARSKHGWIGTIDANGRPTGWTCVELLSDKRLRQIVSEYKAAKKGQWEPETQNTTPAICRNCKVRDICDRRVD